jgi:hypothetical protein
VSLVVHSRQVWVAPSQSIGAGQSVSPRQATHRAAAVSHFDSGAEQSLSDAQPVGAMHWSALPVTVEQLWPAGQPLRGACPHPGWQRPPVPLQTRPESTAPQVWSFAHPQMPRLRRHAGSSGLQSVVLVAVHSLQAPARRPSVRQNGRSGLGQLGAPSPVQATQVWLVEAQSGVMPPQSSAARHPTHTPTPDEVSQRGWVAAQWEVSVAVQAAQAPLDRQIGVAAPQSALLPQARQVWLPKSQTGVAPPHCAFETQATQLPTVVSQTGVAPLQRLALLAEQTPQAPPG